MDLQSLANLGEVVGAIAVVASLLYLATQVRQGTRAQRTENFARALERVSAMQAMLSQDDEMSRLFATGVQDPAKLDPMERIRFTWSLYTAFDAFEFMYLTYLTDEIPEEVWVRWSGTIGWWLGFAGVRTWWVHRPVQFTQSFSALIESMIRDHPIDAERHRLWSVFVATGGAAPPAD